MNNLFKRTRAAIGIVCMLMIALLIFVTSCKTAKVPIVQTVTDSAIVKKLVVVRDTVLFAAAASTKLSVPINEIEMAFKQPLISKDKQAKATAKKVGDDIEFTCECDTLLITAQLRDKYESKYKQKTVLNPPVILRYIPRYAKVLAWIGGIFLTLIAGAAIYWTIKRKLT